MGLRRGGAAVEGEIEHGYCGVGGGVEDGLSEAEWGLLREFRPALVSMAEPVFACGAGIRHRTALPQRLKSCRRGSGCCRWKEKNGFEMKCPHRRGSSQLGSITAAGRQVA